MRMPDPETSRLARFVERRSVLVICLVWLTYLAVTRLWPTSFWLEVPSIRVMNAKAGEDVRMFVDRRINRDFTAHWTAVIRLDNGSDSTVVCAANAVSNYRQGSALPPLVTLSWWTNGRCTTLPPGVYSITTIWELNGGTFLPDKEVEAVSNLFEVTPK